MMAQNIVNLAAAAAFAIVGFTMSSSIAAQATKLDKITIAVIPDETDAEMIARYEGFAKYLTEETGIPVRLQQVTDSAAVVEGLRNHQVDLVRLGPAGYVTAHKVTEGRVEPLAAELDSNGNFGYSSALFVRKDSPFKTVSDLKGRSVAFGEATSTSSYQAPVYYLRQQGIDAEKFFGKTGFVGGQPAVQVSAVHNGTYDAAFGGYRSETSNTVVDVEKTGVVPAGELRIIWISPKLPSSLWAVRADLGDELKKRLTDALVNLKTENPELWTIFAGGKVSGFQRVTHADYQGIAEILAANEAGRRN
jgi:phosphonate transport system substrate-binding protein